MAKMGYPGMNPPLLEAVERLTGLSRNDINRVNISLAGDELPKVEVILTLDASKSADFVATLDAIRTGGAELTFDHLCGDECMWAEHTHARLRAVTQPPAEPLPQRTEIIEDDTPSCDAKEVPTGLPCVLRWGHDSLAHEDKDGYRWPA